MKKMLLIAVLGSSSFLFAQIVCVGPGADKGCVEAQRKVCASEPAPANLELLQDRTVTGIVADQTGAKFDDEVEVQLRVPEKGTVLRSVVTNEGEFSLGQVDAGSYRLIVVKAGKQKVERLKMFDQHKSLVCADDSSICRLSVVPTVHGTDNMIDFCPPK